MGLMANIAVGIIGALVGGFVLQIFGIGGVTGINLRSVLVAILGSCILLYIMNKINR